ncbi:helix-turn-helix transcriptional regulator [Chryseobacterium taihuense]|uniref:DNA-binding transcriptional regulator, XRE-family HTH domain n=1 Tax=Chryseobacterium taihuense TaxID=1141221 RepID=A0ABY0QW21_9FLAO|nr:helix-turn-helix transcriptional regulator [Chryseobacterium taihuense]SDL98435.1 DNA-binding transcriptional regulator, XRE-family HTH domain [Chryseobacterium taihuense]
MKKIKLIETRKRKGITQKKIADVLCMDVSNYNRREKGMAKISMQQWKKIAEVLEIPLEDIYEADENLIFIFNDNSTGNDNFVSNNYNIPLSVWETQKKYIDKLEAENETLKTEVEKLRAEISKKI